MALQLDHTIVPSRDKVRAAQFFARIFGVEYRGPWGHFAPVQVNDTLTLDFDDANSVQSNHYAFLASDDEFDAVLGRVKAEGIVYRQRPARPRRWRDQPSPRWPRLLLQVRGWPSVGAHHAHLHHGLGGLRPPANDGCAELRRPPGRAAPPAQCP